jgi:hypothetical protein
MNEQIIQILERKDLQENWKIRTVIQLWPFVEEERNRLMRFINSPEEI